MVLCRFVLSTLHNELPGGLARAAYRASIRDFITTSPDSVLVAIESASSFTIETTQRDAWREQVRIMRGVLPALDVDGLIAVEFVVPRMGKRIDVLLVVGAVVYVLEFKVGEREFASDALRQVWDYALDMKTFHRTSREAVIVPVLVATSGRVDAAFASIESAHDGVVRPLRATPDSLEELIRRVCEWHAEPIIDIEKWSAGGYSPTPTIVEAAMALYVGHRVEEISRREADAINLTQTTKRIDAIIEAARVQHHKAICFVTGVPGAGKTLVGLDVATRYSDKGRDSAAVFLSGNKPLVDVLREALAADAFARQGVGVGVVAGNEGPLSKGEWRRKVSAFIQIIHHFRDECIREYPAAPHERVALFDEAQRAWNAKQTAKFMEQKKGRSGFDVSEPAYLVSCMDRHSDWAVIVCLVGGGQEINTGEAGIGEWLTAVRRDFPHWHVHLSPHLRDSEYAAGDALGLLSGHKNVVTHESLHLAVSMRSFRAEHVSAWVKAMLDLDDEHARRSLARIRGQYPVVLTRDLCRAKAWLRRQARGSERYGLVASSQAQRLKPHAIDVRVDVKPVHWFLFPRDDVRSSYYLEDAATEFDVQGLELDWACVVWDGDFRHGESGWEHWSFRGSRWQRIKQAERQAYLKNAYRVLLTRARQGMVIVVPEGDAADSTRLPPMYDTTYEYLRGLGVEVLA